MRVASALTVVCSVLSFALGCAQSAPRHACAAPSESPVPLQTSLQPASPSPAPTELEAYLRTVKKQVLPKWRSPVDGRQSVELEFQIAADGCVSYAKPLSKSDRAVGPGVLKALIRAAPFDPPPPGFESEILVATFTARPD